MIALFLIKCFLSVVKFLLSFLPETNQVQLYEISFDIYGYGVYLLGQSFFNWFLSAIIATFGLYMGWFGAVFVFDKVRGSG